MTDMTIKEASSSEFAGKFGHWSFAAQEAPVRVTDQKTGVVKGYFVSAREFGEYLKWRKTSPRRGYAWELSPDLVAELEKPLPDDYPDLEHLMEDGRGGKKGKGARGR